MNRVPPELESHLKGTVTSHCFVWIICREDGVVFGFTDHDQSLNLKDVTCDPQTGLNGSEASTLLGLATSGSEVEGALVSKRISATDIEIGLYDGAAVESYLVNWAEPSQHLLLHRWTIGKITRSGTKFVAEIKGAAAQFDTIHGRRVLRQCDAELGDQRCGINAADLRFLAQGAVVDVALPDIRLSGLDGVQSGWFSNGKLTWKTGANAGRSAVVIGHENEHVRLRELPVFPIVAGDRFSISAGCDKSFAQCKKKFANSVNFRGFPHLPGNDAAYSYVTSDLDFDGGPLVP